MYLYTASGDSEWARITFSSLAGLFVGLLAEPLKQQLLFRLKKRKIYKALIGDLRLIRSAALIVSRVEKTVNGKPDWHLRVENPRADFLMELRIEVFDYYYAHEREALLEIERWSSLARTFEQVKAIQQKYNNQQLNFENASDAIISLVEHELVYCGKLSPIRRAVFDPL